MPRGPQTVPLSFSVVSYNANHSPTNVKAILETSKSRDMILIQEPWYGVLKRTPSASDPTGEEYWGTQADPDWLLLEVSDTRSARVATYIHKRWRGAHPMRRLDVINHPHVLCTSLRFGDSDNLFVNIYGHPVSKEGIHALLAIPARVFTCIAGDFNLHHQRWDSRLGSQGLAEAVTEHMPQLGVDLLNQVDVPTHFPHAANARPSVVDLAWVNTGMI